MKNTLLLVILSAHTIVLCQSDSTQTENNPKTNYDIVYEGLNQIAQAEGRVNYVIFQIDSDQLFQAACSQREPIFYCEITSIQNQGLFDNKAIEQQHRLLEMGWDSPVYEGGNYSKFVIVENDTDLISLTTEFIRYLEEFFDDFQLDPNSVEIVLEESNH